jgi:hypothetical protein
VNRQRLEAEHLVVHCSSPPVVTALAAVPLVVVPLVVVPLVVVPLVVA